MVSFVKIENTVPYFVVSRTIFIFILRYKFCPVIRQMFIDSALSVSYITIAIYFSDKNVCISPFNIDICNGSMEKHKGYITIYFFRVIIQIAINKKWLYFFIDLFCNKHLFRILRIFNPAMNYSKFFKIKNGSITELNRII